LHCWCYTPIIGPVATQRFPRRKFWRQLRDMDEELGVWRASYLEAIATTQSEWLQGRFMDREAVIAELQERVFRASELLEDFPRLS